MPEKKKKKPSDPTKPDTALSATEHSELQQNMAEGSKKIEADAGKRREELQMNMLRSVVTEPLLSRVRTKPEGRFEIIISLNEFYRGGMAEASAIVAKVATDWKVRYTTVSHYVFACLSGKQVLELARLTQLQVEEGAALTPPADGRSAPTIYRIWEDNDVHMALTRSVTTIKADAAQRSFRASGEGIVWAVLDSGIQGDHPHFKSADSSWGPIDSLSIRAPLQHTDFTPKGRSAVGADGSTSATALTDKLGHGTHVAGIIAGHWKSTNPEGDFVVGTEQRNELNEKQPFRRRERLRSIAGVAPACKLVSMKVIADEDDDTPGGEQTAKQGKVSWILLAIDQIQNWNQNGKRILVHGVNLSVGYDFDPRWFACGESPICVEVNRLVKTGVVVVVSAGNGGYTSFLTRSAQAMDRYADLSITDPGNAELAITVGSTHKEMPHRYGVSYFSSRGPTGDGRCKPDLLAPGERIISCGAGSEGAKFQNTTEGALEPLLYVEQTGTSMAAPHVSGAIAAFLSVQTEFIGQPERVKQIFMDSAIDLRRERAFQGSGLIDLMKALQSV
jgi:subtilisin family serine protease